MRIATTKSLFACFIVSVFCYGNSPFASADDPLVPISTRAYETLPAAAPACEGEELSCGATTCEPCAVPESCDDCWCSLESFDLGLPKKQTLHGDWKWTVGGEFRHRYMDERNRLRPAGTAGRDTYDLWRIAPFVQVGNDWITGYVQGIDASIFNEELAALPIDENRADLLQYYLDIKLAEGDNGEKLNLKAGRQFLVYGSQRLISNLGWANTYRNFEGAKLYYTSEDWNIDGFVTRPVNGAALAQQWRPESADALDSSNWLSGLYATNKQAQHGVVDLYWIWSLEEQRLLNRQDGNRHTIGMRYDGKMPVKDGSKVSHTWVWDLEGAFQFGEDSFQSGGLNQDLFAGFVSANGGLVLNQAPMKPTVKGIFWWGSGDSNAADGDINTVWTMYPLGHAYWGLIDNFNGSNLIDLGLQASIDATDKLNLSAAWHNFHKATSGDYIYNIAGAPLGTLGATGSRHIGNELDLLATYQVNPDLQVQMGYFWFWYGNAVNNDPTLIRNDAQQFYVQTMIGF